MTDAYHAGSALEAEAALLGLAGELDRTHPSAAASLREGLDETLTVLRLGVPPTLARTLRSTNCIESMISVCREHAGNVKRWRDGQMALRWCAAGMVEAGKQFRRVNGHLHLSTLRAALERETAESVVPVVHNDQVGRFKGLMQHRSVEASVVVRQRLPPGSSIREPCGACC